MTSKIHSLTSGETRKFFDYLVKDWGEDYSVTHVQNLFGISRRLSLQQVKVGIDDL